MSSKAEYLNRPPQALTFPSPPAVVTSNFPLFKLPDKARRHVIKSMNCDEILFLSLLSEKLKETVTSLNLKSRLVSITITQEIQICILVKHFLADLQFSSSRSLSSMDEMWLVFGKKWRRTNYWISKGLSIKTWFEHIKEIFHFSKIDLWFGEDSITHDMNEIRDTFNSCHEIRISNNSGSEAHVMSILKTFPTAKLMLYGDLFENGEPPSEVFIQNYDELTIEPRLASASTITLEDLLIMNSRNIEVSELSIHEKDVNRFIKHWMKGSNPRMERICINFQDYRTIDIDLVLRNLNYEEGPADRKRYFKDNSNSYYPVETICGGIDIWRRDGTLATITIRENSAKLNMFVWHPHCVTDRR